MRVGIDVADHLPSGVSRGDHRWAPASWDEVDQRRVWLSRVGRLATSRARRLLGELKAEQLLPAEVQFWVDFDLTPRLWSVRKARDRKDVQVELYVPEAIIDLLSIDQAATFLQGLAGSVVEDRLGVAPRMQLVEGGPFPLVSIVAVPRCGGDAVWSRDPDVDAFAKAVNAVNGIWQRSASWGTVTSSWPVLELVPRKRSGVERLAGFGRVGVGIRGFAELSEHAKAQIVVEGIRAGMEGRWGGIAPAEEGSADRVAAVVDDWVAAHGLSHSWISASVPGPSEPTPTGEATETTLAAEYAEDAAGVRVRALVRKGGVQHVSPWHPAGASLEYLMRCGPDDTLDWLDDRTVEVASNPFREKRFQFCLGDAGVDEASGPDAWDEDDLPKAHPAFSAHFTDPLYDDEGSDFGPFGSDEGSELVREWAGRRARLGAGATVSGLLAGEGVVGLDRWLRPIDMATCPDPAALVDEAVFVQSAGFAMLRLTGRIDAEGQTMVLNALDFLMAFYDAPAEYAIQREDLAKWS